MTTPEDLRQFLADGGSVETGFLMNKEEQDDFVRWLEQLPREEKRPEDYVLRSTGWHERRTIGRYGLNIRRTQEDGWDIQSDFRGLKVRWRETYLVWPRPKIPTLCKHCATVIRDHDGEFNTQELCENCFSINNFKRANAQAVKQAGENLRLQAWQRKLSSPKRG